MARKILLADDSVTAQNMGRKILADAGYEVIAVNNGSAALKKIAELKPDLVILDVYMPGYSGLEVCQRLKESQETARIPVLLTVGKLEPFKPEEAQRVRAEGYIVKPFEASELLSALSKLEDKVVPRAEPSKPGRFARAMAAADETDGANRKEPSSTETGWKNRISFPHKKTESEEAVAEKAQPANHDGQKAANKKGKSLEASAPAPETNVDISAFAPIGIPKDVTASEVAAITAAAAQMQVAESATREPAVSEAARPSEFPVEPALERFQDSRDEVQTNSATEVHTAAEVEAGSHELGKLGVSSEPAIETTADRNGEEKLKESQDAPVTMASASESLADAGTGASRWTAVPVAMGSEETSMSLDHEMQKAYAAFAAADYATSAGTVGAETPSQESSSAGSQATIEEPAAAISNSEPAAISEPQPVSAEANLETPKAADLAKPDENAAHVVEFASPARNTEDIAPAPALGSPVAEAATPSTDSFSPVADNSDPKLDSETVKTSAAAWASWRQVRDTGKSSEEPETQPQESAAPDSVPCDTAALAVAAGAEHALPEASAAAPSGNPADVASIVDSVLADLRPKLMEEITRKMAEKKK
ncbi:MAG: hypothetical protein QOF56_557 [Acidobacteriaceae bacterium]|nr:hypothetical protein [Acidobacteriaceae bacterium]